MNFPLGQCATGFQPVSGVRPAGFQPQPRQTAASVMEDNRQDACCTLTPARSTAFIATLLVIALFFLRPRPSAPAGGRADHGGPCRRKAQGCARRRSVWRHCVPARERRDEVQDVERASARSARGGFLANRANLSRRCASGFTTPDTTAGSIDAAPNGLKPVLLSALVTLAVFFATSPVPAQVPPQRPKHVTARMESVIDAKVKRLVSLQSSNGSWHGGRSSYRGGYPVAITGVAGAALLASGNTPQEGPQADAVSRAIDFLLASQSPNGLIATRSEMSAATHAHGFAMLFLGLCYGMETDAISRRRLGDALNAAIKWSTRAQSKNGGWFYYASKEQDEGSTTVTQIQGLRVCRNAGLNVPRTVIDNAAAYLEACQQKDGGICYSFRSRGSSRPAISAAAVATLYSAGEYDNPVALGCLDYLRKILEKSGYATAKSFQGHTYYGALYAAQAMWFAGEKDWDAFFPSTRDWLLSQSTWTGDHVGEAYGIGIGLIILQLPYERLPVFQR